MGKTATAAKKVVVKKEKAAKPVCVTELSKAQSNEFQHKLKAAPVGIREFYNGKLKFANDVEYC